MQQNSICRVGANSFLSMVRRPCPRMLEEHHRLEALRRMELHMLEELHMKDRMVHHNQNMQVVRHKLVVEPHSPVAGMLERLRSHHRPYHQLRLAWRCHIFRKCPWMQTRSCCSWGKSNHLAFPSCHPCHPCLHP